LYSIVLVVHRTQKPQQLISSKLETLGHAKTIIPFVGGASWAWRAADLVVFQHYFQLVLGCVTKRLLID